MTVYIYTLSDPRDGSIRYVGKTTNPKVRLNSHINKIETKDRRKSQWVESLTKDGMRPIMNIVDEAISKGEAAQKEQFWVNKCLSEGCTLFNLHNPVCNGGLPNSRLGKGATVMRTFRLPPSSWKKLSAIKDHFGASSLADALRMLVTQSEIEPATIKVQLPKEKAA